MVGSYEERIKFGWMTSVWRLLEWEVEMYLTDPKQWLDISIIIFLFYYSQKYNKQQSN
jgi:hypothetical protein